ncbi:MAG: N-6 DNA methylase [Archaeoglobales archaeon]|nr:MAG: N-6 DNA methylase [Candidatus Bathyarchaeota archaeon]RLI85774.1 MAG: N-6 DNA methylase [Archaeoglobales archaeon]
MTRRTSGEGEVIEELKKRLIEELGYPENCIQTDPQYRIPLRPSDRKGYPVDVAVFSNPRKADSDLVLIGECKKPNRKEGIKQLRILLGNSQAEVGVWYNGQEHAYICKTFDERGRVKFEEIPSLPKFGQSISDIGRIKRKDLAKPIDLVKIFRDIHNYLAANAVGITRAVDLAEQMIYLLFCKLHDEINKGPDDDVEFCAYFGEKSEELKERIVRYFNEKVIREYADVFEKGDEIKLDSKSIMYVVGELQNYTINALIEENVDAVADAFEVFIGPALKGEKGQYFTPRNVIRMIFEALDPKPDPKTGVTPLIIDPACGTGRFLIDAMRKLWGSLEEEAKKNWSDRILMTKKEKAATRLYGIDKDEFLAKVARAYMALLGNARENVFCTNSLYPSEKWSEQIRARVKLNSFDIVVTNPPHGSKLVETDPDTLEQYELALEWKEKDGIWKVEGTFSMVGRKVLHPQSFFLSVASNS